MGGGGWEEVGGVGSRGGGVDTRQPDFGKWVGEPD